MALFWRVYLLNIYIVFIFSSFTLYIYYSSLITTIILRVYLFIYSFLHSSIHPFIHSFIHLFIYLFICLFIHLLIRGPIRQKGEGSLFCRIFNPGMLRSKGVTSTEIYIYSSSIQPSGECLVINWMVNSRYTRITFNYIIF